MKELVLTCVLMVTTPQGEICIKPDGNVTMPANADITKQSRRFWEELAKTYKVIKTELCI
jgi:hypothetical protein